MTKTCRGVIGDKRCTFTRRLKSSRFDPGRDLSFPDIPPCHSFIIMASRSERALVTVMSCHALAPDQQTLLVEAGGFAPMKWFLRNAVEFTPEESEDCEPPKKKLKRSEGKHVESKISQYAQHIPLSRVVVDLHFPKSLDGQLLDEDDAMEDAEFEENARPVHVLPSIVDMFEDGTKLRLAQPRKSSAVLVLDCDSIPDTVTNALRVDAIPRLQKHGGVSHHAAEYPASWCRCTLTESSGQRYQIVRLEATTYMNAGVSAFPAGIPVGKQKEYPDYNLLARTLPDDRREEMDHTRTWNPQDFYESVHVPDQERDTKKDFEAILDSDLYPFQKRAVHWMLGREGVAYDGGLLRPIQTARRERELSLYQVCADIDGNRCFVDHVRGILQRHRPEDDPINLSGGILAEEMGLGKTVELMALVSLHRRSEPLRDPFVDGPSGIRVNPSKATLIITPNTILQQWKSELEQHAPSLRVMVYEGVATRQTPEREAEMIRNMCTKYDVILATYQTLSREIHFAEDPPDRYMRHKRKFERKRSPLVQIQWWRICLDEAQMVESGVTLAARVARRLPRVQSWAVSGTPLRKNVQDLHGLLIFLGYEPLSTDAKLWNHLITNHRHVFRRVFETIAMRHTKALIREDLQLPQQKRVVITTPFSAVEQQNYANLVAEMCDAVGVHADGSPKDEDWDPDDQWTVDRMRNWLVRLRQSCLHPQVGSKNRKALGRGRGPLRTVAEVLEVMIDQNETEIRVQERAVVIAKLLRAHILGNNRSAEKRSVHALGIYEDAMNICEQVVEDARKKLATAKRNRIEKGEVPAETDDEDSSAESTPILGRLRNNLRLALQLLHTSTFFAATACYQIKSNIELTEPDSDEFKALEEKEMALYERAKIVRKEILRDSSRKSEALMRKIDQLLEQGTFTEMPKFKDLKSLGGIESRRIIEKSDDLFDRLREQGKVVCTWRATMAEYLLKSLVDKDEGLETTGDEYEDSTKLQDELFAYFDAVKAMQTDINTFVTGEKAPLIDYEVKTAIKAAKGYLNKEIVEDMKGQVHAPEKTLELYAIRNKLRGDSNDFNSIRGLIQEARGLEASLLGYETGIRGAERSFVQQHMQSLQSIFRAHTKALAGLEKEIDLFRQTQNQRIEFYRQLQELSDDVKPWREELDEHLDVQELDRAATSEESSASTLQQLKSKNTFLWSLDQNDYAQEKNRTCIICTDTFLSGVLTVCGHTCCKDCMVEWTRNKPKRRCPTCRRELSSSDMHNITYNPMKLRAKEEVQSGASTAVDSGSPSSVQSAIYSEVDPQLLHEIQSIDLPTSYGTKIDTLGRHLHWIREHDPAAKSIVFSQYRDFLDVLGTALHDFKIGYARLGRSGAVEKFKKDPSVDCLLLDAKTDSSGMTLVNATHVFICEPLVQTAVELQAIARVHRIGQTRPTTVWMYLVNETVEEAIYDLSVARRMAHVQARQSKRFQKSRSATPAPLQENAIDAANSAELQSAPLSKLLVNEKGGGELVEKGDLWQCLFGKTSGIAPVGTTDYMPLVERFLRAEAAEERRNADVHLD